MALDIMDELRRRLPGVALHDILTLTEQLNPELEKRVGVRLSEGLTDEQMAEFEQSLDSGEDDAARRWLEVNRPDYLQVTRGVTIELLDEVSERIISADPSAAVGRAQSDTVATPSQEHEGGERLLDWDALRSHLESSFECHLVGDRSATFVFPTATGRSQVLVMRHCNDIWAEVHTAVGRGLDHPALATALRTLSDFVGVGAVTRDDLLIARHGLAYAGLTTESALRTISAVAHAADRAEEASTGKDVF